MEWKGIGFRYMLYSQNSMSTDKVTIVSFYGRSSQANVYFVDILEKPRNLCNLMHCTNSGLKFVTHVRS